MESENPRRTSRRPIGFRSSPSCTTGTCTPKRVLSLAYGTLGVLTSASLAVHAIGQGLAHTRGTLSKHGVKQVDRLLSNTAIELDEFFSYWVPHVIGAREEIVVALDWTSFARDGHGHVDCCRCSPSMVGPRAPDVGDGIDGDVEGQPQPL